jgi:plastocyanin
MILDPRRRTVSIALSAVLFFGIAEPAAWGAETNMIILKNFMFSPMSLTVPAGATVTWKNLDGEPHTVVSDQGLFRSGGFDQNDPFSFKFDSPGTYRFICSIHPTMMGTIVVK